MNTLSIGGSPDWKSCCNLNSSIAQPFDFQYGAPTRNNPASGIWHNPSDKYFTITDPPNEWPTSAALLPPIGSTDCSAIFHARYLGFSGSGIIGWITR